MNGGLWSARVSNSKTVRVIERTRVGKSEASRSESEALDVRRSLPYALCARGASALRDEEVAAPLKRISLRALLGRLELSATKRSRPR